MRIPLIGLGMCSDCFLGRKRKRKKGRRTRRRRWYARARGNPCPGTRPRGVRPLCLGNFVRRVRRAGSRAGRLGKGLVR